MINLKKLFNTSKKEVKGLTDIVTIFRDEGFPIGRMISGSKMGYYDKYPENKIYFNANIIIKSKGKVWYGDLDVTRSFDSLKNIADKIGENIYILSEMDCRFGTEDQSVGKLIKEAKVIIKCR